MLRLLPVIERVKHGFVIKTKEYAQHGHRVQKQCVMMTKVIKIVVFSRFKTALEVIAIRPHQVTPDGVEFDLQLLFGGAFLFHIFLFLMALAVFALFFKAPL